MLCTTVIRHTACILILAWCCLINLRMYGAESPIDPSISHGNTLIVAVDHPKAADSNPGTTDLPFTSITAAIAKAGPGDTVLIQAGIYRETVLITKGGEKDKPLTIATQPGARVIVSGADPIRGWKKCVQEDVGGNTSFDHIYMTDVGELPNRLIESSRKRVVYTLSRLPAEGLWQPDSATGRRTFTDTTHLTAADANAYAGWTLMAYFQAGGGASSHTTFTYDPQKHQITLDRDFTKWADTDPKRDTYWFENNPVGISGPGQFAYRETEQGWRCWIWPTAMEGDQPIVERCVRNECLTPNKVGFLVIDGLELCFANKSEGFRTGQGIGHNVTLTDSVIQNCYIHDCPAYGIGLTQSERVTIRRSVIREVSNGIVISGGSDITVEENDIGWCTEDGMDIADWARNTHIQHNIIHNNNRYAHPDNIQWWGHIDGMWVQDNALIEGGQLIMSAESKNVHLINNVMLGSHACGAILGGESGGPVYNVAGLKPDERSKQIAIFESCSPDVVEVTHNTICATGASPTNWGGTGFNVHNNVIAPLGRFPLYQITSPRSAAVDYNLLWNIGGGKSAIAIITEITKTGDGDHAVLDMKRNWAPTLAVLQDKFAFEQHGIVADPQFTNVPKAYFVSHYGSISSGTRNILIIGGQINADIAIGDHIEIAFDGVCRTITAIGTALNNDKNSTITFDPPLKEPAKFSVSIANWGDKTDFTWNLKLKDISPGHNKASDGTDMGSSINLQNYLRDDFDGDGKRDVPDLPND